MATQGVQDIDAYQYGCHVLLEPPPLYTAGWRKNRLLRLGLGASRMKILRAIFKMSCRGPNPEKWLERAKKILAALMGAEGEEETRIF